MRRCFLPWTHGDSRFMKIPKKLGHIWIGPKQQPSQWMQSWIDRHPDWDYTLYDNDFLRKGNFRTRAQIDEYMKRGSCRCSGPAALRNSLLRRRLHGRRGQHLRPSGR